MSECPLCHSRDCLAHTQPAPTPSHQVALELGCARRQIKALRAELASLRSRLAEVAAVCVEVQNA